MAEITSKADLNRIVAGIMCPEPPMPEYEGTSPRPRISESGAWMWKRGCECEDRNEAHIGYWEPAPFCTDPAAGYRLEQWAGGGASTCLEMTEIIGGGWVVEVVRRDTWTARANHTSRLIALCLAVCAAHGVELSLADGWDQK